MVRGRGAMSPLLRHPLRAPCRRPCPLSSCLTAYAKMFQLSWDREWEFWQDRMLNAILRNGNAARKSSADESQPGAKPQGICSAHPAPFDDPLRLSAWLIYRPQLPANWVILTPVDRTGQSSHTVVNGASGIRQRHHYHHRRRRSPFDVWRRDWGLNRGWNLGPDLTLYG